MKLRQCKKCKKVLSTQNFYQREDTIDGLYSWCIFCMVANGRSMDYPDEKERGGGVTYTNYKSLGKDFRRGL